MRLRGGKYTCLGCGESIHIPAGADAHALFLLETENRPVQRVIVVDDEAVHRCAVPNPED